LLVSGVRMDPPASWIARKSPSEGARSEIKPLSSAKEATRVRATRSNFVESARIQADRLFAITRRRTTASSR
jgi:hypothetical protein